MAINLTGQLTDGDNNISGNSNYIRITLKETELNSFNPPEAGTKSKMIVVELAIYRNKNSYNNNKKAIQNIGENRVIEIQPNYIIDAATIATAPQSNFNGLPGKSLHDKYLYWVHQQVLAQITTANPTFSGSIVDINL